MERDWRASYCFIPSYDKKGLTDITGVHQASIRKALDRGIADGLRWITKGWEE
jgi:hypothetical protein